MDAKDFLSKLAENTQNYEVFEYRTLLDIIRYCDPDTRSTFFPNAAVISGYDDGYREIAVKLVCYAISTITDYNFNKAIVSNDYSDLVGRLLPDQDRWMYIFKKFIANIYPGEMNKELINSVFEMASTEQFILGSIMKMEAESELEVRLVFEYIRCYCGDRFEEFAGKWENAAGVEKISRFRQTEYFSTYIKDDRLVLGIKDDVKAAITNKTNVNTYPKEVVDEIVTYPNYTYYVVIHNEYDVGQAVLNWLDSDTVSRYGLRSKDEIKTHYDDTSKEYHTENAATGCVSAETLITMSDGSSKQISEICEGDLILSEGMVVSQTSDELVINKRINAFYGINEIQPFMSLEHAVMTQEGWKSLLPEKSNEINPHFQVGLLREGDVVLTLRGEIRVEKITIKHSAEGEYFTGYDLHVREGRNSYFANDILVLLNYPQMTRSRIFRNLNAMETVERRKFIELVFEHEKLFEQVFGVDSVEYFKEGIYAEFKNDFSSIT